MNSVKKWTWVYVTYGLWSEIEGQPSRFRCGRSMRYWAEEMRLREGRGWVYERGEVGFSYECDEEQRRTACAILRVYDSGADRVETSKGNELMLGDML
ncbi:hypothetical protein Sjap_008727 [Stephania japonica]|uniref:Uncharacterized protein n=1 Tax=Stephania japonica TaxID=461633 RepID=A0AAP0JQ29_9MAGN